MDTNISKLSKTAKAIIGVMAFLIAILFFLVLRTPSAQSNNLLGDKISVRQDAGKVQWQFAGSDDWQTITTVSDLTGQKGDKGAKGEQGEQGEKGEAGNDGKNGTNGKDGANGKNGTDGKDGKDGADGAQGEKGEKGDNGEAGATGATGAQGIQGAAGQDGQNGADGKDGVDGVNGINGTNGTNGTDGREIELQKDLYYIQWRYVGEPGWRNLIAYSDLKGDKGDKGDTGATGPANTLTIGSVTKPSDCTPTASITGTAPNQVLNLGIPGLPNGGTTGQVLMKNSSADCDAIWANTNVIVGAGRPDISASMDTGTQAKVASATSGTEFRSTDGPQGAWVWMKQGSVWKVTSGDTGWRDIASLLVNGWQVGIGGRVHLRRVDTTVLMNVVLRNDTATSQVAFGLPLGFRGESSTSAAFAHGGNIYTGPYFSGGTDLQMTGLYPTPTVYNAPMFQNIFNTAQNWPSSLPGTAV